MIKDIVRKTAMATTFFMSLLWCTVAKAQTPKQVMERIYQAYDSVPYLSFDVRYRYDSDTLYGDFTHEVMEGTYTMAGKKAKYRLGDIDFIQNDSFFIAIYNTEKYIIVADPKSSNSGNELPMRQLIDSLVDAYSLHYTLTTSMLDSTTGKISFTATDSTAAFSSFAIVYDTSRHFLKCIDYSFIEPPFIDPDVTYVVMPVARKKRLRIEFSRYRVDHFSPDIYHQNSYIFFEDGVCKPVDRYSGYRIFYSRTGNN